MYVINLLDLSHGVFEYFYILVLELNKLFWLESWDSCSCPSNFQKKILEGLFFVLSESSKMFKSTKSVQQSILLISLFTKNNNKVVGFTYFRPLLAARSSASKSWVSVFSFSGSTWMETRENIWVHWGLFANRPPNGRKLWRICCTVYQFIWQSPVGGPRLFWNADLAGKVALSVWSVLNPSVIMDSGQKCLFPCDFSVLQ